MEQNKPVKTEQEILVQIATLKAADEHFDTDLVLHGMLHVQIRGLEWVLGIRHPSEFYCHSCQIIHEEQMCPKCGHDTMDDFGTLEAAAGGKKE